MTNYKVLYSNPHAPDGKWYNPEFSYGPGFERFEILKTCSITNAWYTNAYRRETNPLWVSDLAEVIAYTNDIFNAWASHPKEYFRNRTNGGQPWWQTVHTSIYDLTNRVLRVAVQEVDDWYVFQVPSNGAIVDAYTKAETDARLAGKLEGPTDDTLLEEGKAADAKAVGDRLYSVYVDIGNLNGAVAAVDEKADANGQSINTLVVVKIEKISNPNQGCIPKITENGQLENTEINADNVLQYDDITDPATAEQEYSVADAKKTRDFVESKISATDTTFSNAVMGVASHTNAAFAAEVLAVQVASLSTNITEEVYIAATNACANLGIDTTLIPQGGTLGTVGGLLVALAAAVALLRKKTKLLKSDGTAEDDFATNLLGKQVAKTALMIPLEAKTDSFAAEDGHAYAVTMTGTVTITMPTATTGKAAIFQARFSAAAQQSVQFSTDAVIKFDGADCGVVKAGKDALLSAMWNGTAWDLVWKNQA